MLLLELPPPSVVAHLALLVEEVAVLIEGSPPQALSTPVRFLNTFRATELCACSCRAHLGRLLLALLLLCFVSLGIGGLVLLSMVTVRQLYFGDLRRPLQLLELLPLQKLT